MFMQSSSTLQHVVCPAGVLGEGPADKFDPVLLREEPLEKVQAVLLEARRIHEL